MKAFDDSFFDVIYERRGTGAVKYEADDARSDVIPMWLADMDFKSPPAVEEAIVSRARHGIFGYTEADGEYDALVAAWYKKRFGWEFGLDAILKAPGVIFAAACAIRALTEAGDGVLVCQPVYYPFMTVITQNARRLVVSELVSVGGRYELDFDDIEKKLRGGVKLFLLCSPHNPVGRVWTREELIRIAELCEKYDVYIVSDEIHSDFVFSEHAHIPIASLSPRTARRTVTCTSPSKTFNLAGLQSANIIIPERSLRAKVRRQFHAAGYSCPAAFAVTTTAAAYRSGEPWLDGLLAYLRGNFDLVSSAFADGPISLIPPEGTFLGWLDCRGLGMSDGELESFFLREAGVRLSGGAQFGAGGSGFMRMNVGCPRSVLRQALSRIDRSLKKL